MDVPLKYIGLTQERLISHSKLGLSGGPVGTCEYVIWKVHLKLFVVGEDRDAGSTGFEFLPPWQGAHHFSGD